MDALAEIEAGVRAGELRRSAMAGLLGGLYRAGRMRKWCLASITRREDGEFYSATLRELLYSVHGVSVGAYSYGGCMVPGAFPKGVTIGRYTSVAPGVQVYLRDHPMDRLSMHPFFYNADCGYVETDNVENSQLSIGHDVWIGANAMIVSGCDRIGNGAVIAAGAVVTKDVPDFAIVAGVPGEVLRYRFPEALQDRIRESEWWLKPAAECAQYLDEMVKPFTEESAANHPLVMNEFGDGG